MNYMELMNYLSTLNIKKIELGSPELLAIIINNKKSEFYPYFTINAWTIENLKLLLDNINNENELFFLTSYHFGYMSDEVKDEFVKALIDKNYFTFLISEFGFADKIHKNPEYLEMFLSNIANSKISYRELKKLIYGENANSIIDGIVKAKRVDYISFLLADNYFIEKDTTSLLPLVNEIYQFITLFNFKIPISTYIKHLKLFKKLFLLGDLEGIKSIQYHGSETLKKFIESDEEILNKIIEYAKTTTDEEFFNVTQRIPNLETRSDYLKVLLERKYFKIINFFKIDAWTLENQSKYLKLLSEEKEIPTFGLISKCPLISYKVDYMFGTSYIRDTTYTSIDNNDSFNNFEICIKIGKDITNGVIENNSIITQYYQFIYNTNSRNIHKLVIALTEKNINNLDRLFDENGITPYFKEYLLFDTDYIFYRGNELIEEVNNAEYANYLKILYLDEKIREYIKDLFIDNNNLLEYINESTVTRKFVENSFNKKGIPALAILINNNFNLPLNDTEKKLLLTYIKIENIKTKEIFLDYCLKNKENIEDSQIDSIYDLIIRITNSNSFELRKQSDNIIANLIHLDNYNEVYNDLEYIFTSGSSPEFMKRFIMYKVILGDRDLKKDYAVTSPVLKKVTREEADKIIINDLLKISLATSSKDIEKYFHELFVGGQLYTDLRNLEISTKQQKEYSFEELEILQNFRYKLEFLFKYLLKLEFNISNNDYETIKNMEKAFLASKNMLYGFEYHFPIWQDLIIEKVFGEQPSILSTHMGKHRVIKTALEEAKKIKGITFSAKEGDFIKGIDSCHLDNIFTCGSLSKEFLGEDIQEDGTHLDTDMSLITRNVETIPELLSLGVTGCNHGDMNLVISNDYMRVFNDYIETTDSPVDKEFTDEEKRKNELFRMPYSKDHYGIRTGFPLTYVSAIVASKNYSRAKFILLKNKFYIPMYDRQGNLIFTYEDYYNNQKLLDGLSYYDINTYDLSENLITDETQTLLSEIDENAKNIAEKRNIIFNKLNEVLNKYFKNTRHKIGFSVEKEIAELIDTGSTGRNTSVDKEGDFDFILRLDREFILSDKLSEFSSEIYKLFGKTPGDSKIIRMENVKIDGIDEPLKLDITIIDKNSKIDYSTDMCINDRLNTIKKLYPDQYNLVIANIIEAKKFFKNIGRYKKQTGGFGGVGVENFVLQHGGSFYDAITSFLECSRSCKNLNEFKEKYSIYDFGKNYYAYEENDKQKFPYDNYVNYLTDVSYKEMIIAFEEYINQTKDIKMV